MEDVLILSERDAARARKALARIETVLSPSYSLTLAAQGFAPSLLDRHATMLAARKSVLTKSLAAFDQVRNGDTSPADQWRTEPGAVLILARLAKGLSQRELALRLGMKEQQVQRYESEYYSAISLANLKKVAAFLNVNITATLASVADDGVSHLLEQAHDYPTDQLEKVVRFVKKSGWLPDKYLNAADSDPSTALLQYLASTRDRYGSPALLRTGLHADDYHNDLALLAWRARASDIAQHVSATLLAEFDPTDISWLKTLVRASVETDGPRQAVDILAAHGIALIVVPNVPSLKLDGAAFIESGVPVIALTLRYDRIDSFWFTLLHELGHIYLHLHSGLRLGFFDDTDTEQRDVAEQEANDFAGACIVPPDVWRTSPARITKSEGAVDKLAQSLEINPALLFGRIRKERGDYKLFTMRVGQGGVRRWWLDKAKEPEDGWTNE